MPCNTKISMPEATRLPVKHHNCMTVAFYTAFVQVCNRIDHIAHHKSIEYGKETVFIKFSPEDIFFPML